MKEHKVGIIMNGVTGRMGTNQHLMRSIMEIIRQGGVRIKGDSETIMPDPVLVGRNKSKLVALSRLSGVGKYTTDIDSVLSDPGYQIYFDSQTTDRRVASVRDAIKAGKHVYCEKPISEKSQEAMELHELAESAGVKSGVVQDKLWLPGLLKMKNLVKSGFFGKILSVRGEFGYWVFEGDLIKAQRPSWNYRKEDGGGMIVDMFAHWRYVIDNLFGEVKSVSCLGATHIERRWDENAKEYKSTADDSAYATFELENGIIAQFNSSWTTRVRRDDLFTMQVDGTNGSAVAGLRKCWIQPSASTPRAVWNPDIDSPIDFHENWYPVPDTQIYENAFKIQWELFLKHVVADEPFRWTLLEGAKGVQLSEKALESWDKRKWIEIPNLK